MILIGMIKPRNQLLHHNANHYEQTMYLGKGFELLIIFAKKISTVVILQNSF